MNARQARQLRVHPRDIPPLDVEAAAAAQPRQGVDREPRGKLSLYIRGFQFAFSASLFYLLLLIKDDFPFIRSLFFFVTVAGMEVVWSLSMVFLDCYAHLTHSSLKLKALLIFFSIGDGIMSTLVSYVALGFVTIVICLDQNNKINDRICSEYHCKVVYTAMSFAYLTSFAAFPSFFFNLRSLVSYPQ